MSDLYQRVQHLVQPDYVCPKITQSSTPVIAPGFASYHDYMHWLQNLHSNAREPMLTSAISSTSSFGQHMDDALAYGSFNRYPTQASTIVLTSQPFVANTFPSSIDIEKNEVTDANSEGLSG